MKTILLILFPFLLTAQRDILYHNLAGHAISMSTGWATYKATDRIGLSLITGLTCGVIAGIAKEEIWDRKWKRGTPSMTDKLATGWGAFVGTVCLSVCIEIREKKQYLEYEKYNFKTDSCKVQK